MGTSSFILAGIKPSEGDAFSSAIHGAGRAMSRHEAARMWQGRQVVDELASRGILVRCKSMREIAEEAPGAYKDVTVVVESAVKARSGKVGRSRRTDGLHQGLTKTERSFWCLSPDTSNAADKCSSWLTLWRAPLILG